MLTLRLLDVHKHHGVRVLLGPLPGRLRTLDLTPHPKDYRLCSLPAASSTTVGVPWDVTEGSDLVLETVHDVSRLGCVGVIVPQIRRPPGGRREGDPSPEEEAVHHPVVVTGFLSPSGFRSWSAPPYPPVTDSGSDPPAQNGIRYPRFHRPSPGLSTPSLLTTTSLPSVFVYPRLYSPRSYRTSNRHSFPPVHTQENQDPNPLDQVTPVTCVRDCKRPTVLTRLTGRGRTHTQELISDHPLPVDL